MRRKACALLLSAAMGGCMSMDHGDTSPACTGSWGKQHGPPAVPGVAGPHGQNVAMIPPYNAAPPGNPWAARQMMGTSVPLDMVQINQGGNASAMGGVPGGMMPAMPMPPGGLLSPPGVPAAPGMPAGPAITPTSFLPGGDAGVIPANLPPGAASGGIMLAQHGGASPLQASGGVRFSAQRSQIRFTRPTGMKVAWFAQGPDGRPTFSNVPLEAPARYNFTQGAIYKLKISGIEGRPGLEVYPTMEVVPANPKTEAFLAHSSVPVEFTQDDFKQIAEGNYVTKVIYLPDPQFQDVAGSGTDEIVSTRLEPGADPIQEALRRGSILVIIRMGNVDEEAPNTPPLTTPAPRGPIPGGPGAGHPPHVMVPYPGYMPKTGALPPGGPMIGAPGNPQLPPGFHPMFPPPPGPQPMPPQFGAGAPPTGDLNAGPLVPPPASTGAPQKIDTPTLPQIPPPAPPTPSTSETKKTPAANPIAPATPTTDVKKTNDVSVPPLPTAPGAGASKKTDATPPALPVVPTSKANTPMPTITPASAPPMPILPEVTGPPVVPAFPATPGTIRPADPLGASPAIPPIPALPGAETKTR